MNNEIYKKNIPEGATHFRLLGTGRNIQSPTMTLPGSDEPPYSISELDKGLDYVRKLFKKQFDDILEEYEINDTFGYVAGIIFYDCNDIEVGRYPFEHFFSITKDCPFCQRAIKYQKILLKVLDKLTLEEINFMDRIYFELNDFEQIAHKNYHHKNYK